MQPADPDHRFAEPVALSSTESTDLPLARTAARLSFDLLALRARRKEESKSGRSAFKSGVNENRAICGRAPAASADLT